MAQIELLVIDHKNSDDYFRGFYSEAQIPSYSFQLQRMFDFGNAIIGEYLVVKIDNKPFMQFHVIRTNSSRIIENPLIAKDVSDDFVSKYFENSLDLIFDNLFDFYEYSPSPLPLFFHNSNETKFSELFQKVIDTRGSLFVEDKFIYKGKTSELATFNIEYSIDYITSLPLEKRYDLVSNLPTSESFQIEKFYQDLIETGEYGEQNWRIIKIDNKFSGFALFTINKTLYSECDLFEIYREPLVDKVMFYSALFNELSKISQENELKYFKIASSEEIENISEYKIDTVKICQR
ncbi:MAG: hypothetical protein JXR48_15360 [Candidatus Delongbacteria bacterium]|nr:hypothetical protein [Candidatus Delongbacteria bacterium]MBN2836333.1 hypothetical protein [Candidatus Delongbacteria bacterium]